MEKSIQSYLIDYLYKLTSKFAFDDMVKAQSPNRKHTSKIKPYSLSDDTLEAKEYYSMALAGTNEEEIKSYLLKIKLSRGIEIN